MFFFLITKVPINPGKSWGIFLPFLFEEQNGWLGGWFMVFNATFNNISVISWRSVLKRHTFYFVGIVSSSFTRFFFLLYFFFSNI